MHLNDDKKFLAALLSIPGVGYQTVFKLRRHFSSYEEIWRADETELASANIEHKTGEAISNERSRTDPAQKMYVLEKEGVSLIEPRDENFPLLLKEIPFPPQWLYIKGRVTPNEKALAVVGSRKPTSYGREATERIISELAAISPVAVISGCAVGIDAQAHRSSLNHGLRTVAVIGSGLDRQSFFPAINYGLAQNIIEAGGALISEYPLGMPGFKQNFIQRNRIISGLSAGVLIVEAAKKSGTLITARFALEQGREVFAVPGSIFSPYSSGTNALIAEGARITGSAEDIINELNLPVKRFSQNAADDLTDEQEKNILKNLDEPKRVDELVRLTRRETGSVISSLSMLELKGMAKNIGGKWTRI